MAGSTCSAAGGGDPWVHDETVEGGALRADQEVPRPRRAVASGRWRTLRGAPTNGACGAGLCPSRRRVSRSSARHRLSAPGRRRSTAGWPRTLTAPKKQRHTARRIWQRLVDEHDAEVSESTVRHYVAEGQGTARRSRPAEVMVPQTHPLGLRGRGRLRRGQLLPRGELTSAWMFVMRLSASGKGFHRVYANQAQEAFIDGHVRAFEHFGGVARSRPLRQPEARGGPGAAGPQPHRDRALHRAAQPLPLRRLLLPPGQGRGPREGRGRRRSRPVPAPPHGAHAEGRPPWPS